ncbi:hypothetical protein GCK72_004762 [Caenorhabditis remanei]|uniref:Uncharacterized protein n=1 Tax=Caenorhabditis remanei TaxID=31234 RepID=A0A6A5HEY9_CAERE|nr:hypothetical protein GCK72_004762 [Caenorhabditis remanei]KAF1764812.1 hypothetical protein GCK72_004762 [Caenorhabditis remanei]
MNMKLRKTRSELKAQQVKLEVLSAKKNHKEAMETVRRLLSGIQRKCDSPQPEFIQCPRVPKALKLLTIKLENSTPDINDSEDDDW